MSGDWAERWWLGGNAYDRRQDERYQSVQSQLASQMVSQRSQALRLRTELANVQGTLEHRLDQLATAFDAFVELSDLREELRVFQPEATARHHTRRRLAQIVAGDGLSSVEPDVDVAGYWLPAAATGLMATLTGDATAAESALSTARARDLTRSDLFLGLGLLLAGRSELALDQLAPLLDLRVGQKVTPAQRVLWQAAADGLFGTPGKDLVMDRLGSAVAGLSPGDVDAQVADWRSLVEGLAPEPSSSGAASPRRSRPAYVDLRAAARPVNQATDILTAVGRASEQLDRLSRWCGEQLALPADPASSTPPLVTDDSVAPDPVFALLQELVDEGAPEEQPLLNRVAELRRIVEAQGGQSPPPQSRWLLPTHDLLALLRTDAATGASPGQRVIALRAGGRFVLTVADELAQEASQPLPADVPRRVGRSEVRFGPDGARPDSVEAARTALDPATSPALLTERQSQQVAWGLLAAGFVATLVGMGTSLPVLLLVGLAGIVGGVMQLANVRARTRAAEQYRRSEWARREEDIARIGGAVADLYAQATTAATDAVVARSAIESLLAPDGPPRAPVH